MSVVRCVLTGQGLAMWEEQGARGGRRGNCPARRTWWLREKPDGVSEREGKRVIS